MQLADLQAIAQGVPSIYRGYEKMSTEDVTGSFEIDGDISIMEKYQKAQNPETKKWEIVTNPETGDPYFDYVVFLPIAYNGKKVIVATTSRHILQVIRAMDTKETIPGDKEGVTLFVKDGTIEGKLRFGQKDQPYGKKGNIKRPCLEMA